MRQKKKTRFAFIKRTTTKKKRETNKKTTTTKQNKMKKNSESPKSSTNEIFKQENRYVNQKWPINYYTNRRHALVKLGCLGVASLFSG